MEFKNKKAAMHNLGCKVNSYEAEAMVTELREAGVEIVSWDTETADIYIINTCSVTNIADRKSRQMIHKARAMNPDAVVIAVGCYVQARSEELREDSAVDILVGNNEKSRILPILEKYYMEHPEKNFTVSEVKDISSEHYYEELNAGEISDEGRVFIKVQDGCNQYCSYCIIPYVRGRIRSRSVQNTLKEVQDFAERGYHEIVLTGIHLSSYGLDFDDSNYEYAMNHDIPSVHLVELIKSVAAVKGIERVRLGSLEPRIITEQFVEELKKIPEICPHFHLSLQSGCDRTLKAMNRHYDTKDFRNSVDILRRTWPNVSVTTDVIVGFPGETEEDFETSYRFIDEISFYELHVFKYSRRQGTAADKMKDQVPDKIKTERSERLISLDRLKSEAFRKNFIGEKDDIIPEDVVDIHGKKYLRGYNKCYVRYLVPFTEIEDPESKIGQIIEVQGTDFCETCVLAMPV
ncbi:tRNA (N(6)-L-threonylcarbamoyladenosine(37)-C(2))-methylthiotransferase MtaB [Oribacterium sp. WCC10]|uniref:tRNA (N(6)-L-threonylcarbamoyladenosine(37)-C(2))- methylthiotransferase MtaB n=1 Tax=Oribacterium sp. WCC10 TaxID=1855343 RepID=UPI0008E36265|nr:tRNA (N(6)-L-threonylcarbamoyladenosine(37)-C(2))-methylthiotransferase MtaB [Oribacterium sp. WCC10]SFG38900.1 threonylcarbamoyladenosine tRNA methylthiotransferase MtaB [Oribacterium sp. WCC10]